MPRAISADWTAIRREREETGTTYRVLAEKFGVSRHAVEKRAFREGWTVRQKAVKEAVARLIPERAALEKAREQVASRAAEAVADQIATFLSEAVRQAVEIMAHGKLLAVSADNPRDFKDATSGWAMAHDGARKAHGLDRREADASGSAWSLPAVSIIDLAPVESANGTQ